jgi:hypothetical protein
VSGQFTDIAKRAFSFLEDEGFQLTESESRSLRYENSQVFVAVAWDPPGELNVWLGLLPRKGHRAEVFSLSDLLNMGQAGKSGGNMPPQVADESRLEPFLEELATKMRTHAAPALAGDRMYFRRLETFRSAQSDAYMRDMKLRQVRSEAEKAWHERNFREVARLYKAIEQDLSASEKAKLAYARKHEV